MLLVFGSVAAVAQQPAGTPPVDAEGKPLNLGFESGTLDGWKVEGDAFSKQPIKGDAVAVRRKDMRSGHAGEFWIGTFEVTGDDGIGTLTSPPFKVTQPWASFLVGGGDWAATAVEIIDAARGETLFTARGTQDENLKRAVVDLRKHQGKEIMVRVVDKQRGHWGHINFDDFLFHATEPKFANALPNTRPSADEVKFAGLPADQAAAAITLPEGFSATAFAAEPDVTQPIAFCIDDRGRLWVVEGHTYPQRAKDGEGRDRILVFEDTDGDGRFNKRTLFMEKLNLVSGIEVGFGGVYIGAAPHLLFVPIKEGDEPQPAGEPRVLLDGWAWQDTHETLNTFTWGPDGWLYGCHGVFTHSNVGKPGVPNEERQKINAGVWRFHPIRHEFEVFAHGTSNPWGIDFDENGQCFIEACVIPHLFHMIQGGRYQRQAGPHFNPHTYDDIKTIADHRHYVGANPHGGNNRSDLAGGGHAHAGLLIYQSDAWPEQFRGKMLMNNIHGQRLNMDIAERKGSGFVGKHAPDFCNFNDRWSQVVNLLSDQDGSVYLIDWYDRQQCHVPDPAKHDQSNGRIFKLIYNNAKGTRVDLASKSDLELAQLQLHTNSWHRRHASRLLQERASKGRLSNDAAAQLLAYVNPDNRPMKAPIPASSRYDDAARLRALWTLHMCGAADDALLTKLLGAPSEYLRGWAIQLAAEDGKVSDAMRNEWVRLAAEDKSPVVRLYLASACQRLSIEQRVPILEKLVAHAEDAEDHNLPLMYWYATEPLVAKQPAAAAALLGSTRIPILQEYIARRMAAAD